VVDSAIIARARELLNAPTALELIVSERVLSTRLKRRETHADQSVITD
jgi:hypothetical protein